jgi:hypothetical protein
MHCKIKRVEGNGAYCRTCQNESVVDTKNWRKSLKESTLPRGTVAARLSIDTRESIYLCLEHAAEFAEQILDEIEEKATIG